MEVRGKCLLQTSEYHTTTNNRLRQIVSNQLGARVFVCEGCVSYKLKTKECGLCGMLCAGDTLALPKEAHFWTPCTREPKEVFCYECVGKQLPEYLSRVCTADPEVGERIFKKYLKLYMPDEPIDFSSPATIKVQMGEKTYTWETPNQMGRFCYAIYKIARYDAVMKAFLRDEFIPEMRRQRVAAGCEVQIARQRRVEEGDATVCHFIPLAKGLPRARELLHPRYVRHGSTLEPAKIREENNFDAFLDLLQGY